MEGGGWLTRLVLFVSLASLDVLAVGPWSSLRQVFFFKGSHGLDMNMDLPEAGGALGGKQRGGVAAARRNLPPIQNQLMTS